MIDMIFSEIKRHALVIKDGWQQISLEATENFQSKQFRTHKSGF